MKTLVPITEPFLMQYKLFFCCFLHMNRCIQLSTWSSYSPKGLPWTQTEQESSETLMVFSDNEEVIFCAFATQYYCTRLESNILLPLGCGKSHKDIKEHNAVCVCVRINHEAAICSSCLFLKCSSRCFPTSLLWASWRALPAAHQFASCSSSIQFFPCSEAESRGTNERTERPAAGSEGTTEDQDEIK